MIHRDTAARSERQVFALTFFLHDVQRDLVGVDRRIDGRQAGRKPRDLARNGHVAFEVRGGNRKRVGEVIEAAVCGVVAGQQRFHVEVDGEQIADRVVVFRAIEAMHGADPSGIRARASAMRDPSPARACPATLWYVSASGRGTARRRHGSRTQFRNDLFDELCVRGKLRGIQRREIDSRGAGLLVVTCQAVLVEDRAGRGRSCAPPCIRNINAAKNPQCKAWKICASG